MRAKARWPEIQLQPSTKQKTKVLFRLSFSVSLCVRCNGLNKRRRVLMFLIRPCRTWVRRCRRARCVTMNSGWRWSSATSPVTGTTPSSVAGRFMKITLSSPATLRSCWRYWYAFLLNMPTGFIYKTVTSKKKKKSKHPRKLEGSGFRSGEGSFSMCFYIPSRQDWSVVMIVMWTFPLISLWCEPRTRPDVV